MTYKLTNARLASFSHYASEAGIVEKFDLFYQSLDVTFKDAAKQATVTIQKG
jgi:type VI protein secretion system component Hcp